MEGDFLAGCSNQVRLPPLEHLGDCFISVAKMILHRLWCLLASWPIVAL